MDEDEKRRKRGRRRLLLISLLIAVPLILHFWQTHRVRQLAEKIQVGDTRAQVVAILGPGPISYTVAPPFGNSGICYGGLLHVIRSHFDMAVSVSANGAPMWYQQYLALGFDEWPVHVEFDKAGNVTRVSR